MSQDDEVLATIYASTTRRWIAVLSMLGLGILLIYIAFAQPPALGWQVFLILIGAGSMWLGDALRRATERVIELTETELRDSSGEVIALVDDIQSVDRGFFAFKPSNGFLMRTRAPVGKRRWLPGLWWRLGRTIGVGGVTPGHQTKVASEILSTIIAQRDNS